MKQLASKKRIVNEREWSINLVKIKRMIGVWYIRYVTRKELARLDARQIKDIGLSRQDQVVESNKPFWK